jgi:hypothetical protein
VRTTAAKSVNLESDEYRQLVIERVRRFFGMTLEEFATAFRAGDLDDRPIALDLALLVGVKRREK